MAVHSRSAGVDTPAPEFELPDAAGDLHRLSELRKGGPVVLVFLRGFM